MAKAKAKQGGKRKRTVSLAVIAGFAPGVQTVWRGFQAAGLQGGLTMLSRAYTGFDPESNRWVMSELWRGTFPLLIGGLVHKGAGMLGINRMLARAGIPGIRL